VLVRVHASSVNPVDNSIAAGMLAGMGVEHDYRLVLGRDYAGLVEQVGAAAAQAREPAAKARQAAVDDEAALRKAYPVRVRRRALLPNGKRGSPSMPVRLSHGVNSGSDRRLPLCMGAITGPICLRRLLTDGKRKPVQAA
jgi:hypothetical protein